MTDRFDVHPCLSCGNPYLEGYPHRHATEPRGSYDPMPSKPSTRAGLVAVIAREFAAEKPPRLHVRQVPSRAEPIGVSQYSAEAAGYVVTDESMDVLDTGELGAPPWAPAFHRYIGGVSLWDGELVSTDMDPEAHVWSKNLHSLRRWCAGKHATWYEHAGRPVCWSLVMLVVFGGYSLGRAAVELDIIPEKADMLLFGHLERACDCKKACPPGALERWWSWVSNDMNGVTLRRVRAA